MADLLEMNIQHTTSQSMCFYFAICIVESHCGHQNAHTRIYVKNKYVLNNMF